MRSGARTPLDPVARLPALRSRDDHRPDLHAPRIHPCPTSGVDAVNALRCQHGEDTTVRREAPPPSRGRRTLPTTRWARDVSSFSPRTLPETFTSASWTRSQCACASSQPRCDSNRHGVRHQPQRAPRQRLTRQVANNPLTVTVSRGCGRHRQQPLRRRQ